MAQRVNQEFIFVIVGATGAVGRELLRLLEERKFPIKELRLVASKRSFGKTLEFRREELPIRELTPEVFNGAHIAFFTAGGNISREFAPIAAKAGAVVLDDSGTFRMDADVPLVVPEVNPHLLETMPPRRIFPVANCSVIQLVVALAPLHRAARIKRVVLSTYQSTSGAGRRAMEELSRQVSDLFNYREPRPDVFPAPIAFNVLPHIDRFLEDGSTVEETKIAQETRKILEDESIGVSVTAVRVPTFHCHAEAVNVETEENLSPEKAKEILKRAPGIVLVDDGDKRPYPVLTDAEGKNEVYVGRVRKDSSRPNCLNLWVVGDNLRKGAALNALQILEGLRGRNLI